MNDGLSFYFTWQGQQTGVLVYLIVILANTLLNALMLRRLDSYSAPPRWPSVAVLIPARNEENTIRRCVESLLIQDYPDYAIWVLDDQSTDNTAAILDELSTVHSLLTILSGQPIPNGWLGKPWACKQLAEASDSELLLFVDSDTWHHPAMLCDAVSALEGEQADLLSVIPDEVMESTAEKLSVPVIPWSLFTHFPLALAQKINWTPLSTAIGQMMLFRRSAYQRLGGHEVVRSEIAEDLAFARQVARSGGRARILDGVSRVHCRMYHSWPEVWSGFGKNLFSGFGNTWWLFLFVWIWLGIAFLSPFAMLLWWMAGNRSVSPVIALSSIVLAAAIWAIYVRRLRAPLVLIPLYPAIMASALVLAAHSLVQRIRGRATWKGRRLV
jgi:chlorobactene glucosyltransferase